MGDIRKHFEQHSIFDEFDHLQFWRGRHDESDFSEGAQKTPKTWAYNGCICFCHWCIGFGLSRRIKKFPRVPRLWVFKKQK